MSKYIIPLKAEPNQVFNIELERKQCVFEFITRGVFLYMNLNIDGKEIINGIICLNKVNLIQYNDFAFNGKVYFEDTQGNLDPLYYGLNDRWLLIYED